ncbi:hypothetical protein BYT27DRAFT_6500543 [Phlegmacium glaucopus]|nr:hypothetical protein BYT27DRAFT_6500543 [Phlegmacium glaucopus]
MTSQLKERKARLQRIASLAPTRLLLAHNILRHISGVVVYDVCFQPSFVHFSVANYKRSWNNVIQVPESVSAQQTCFDILRILLGANTAYIFIETGLGPLGQNLPKLDQIGHYPYMVLTMSLQRIAEKAKVKAKKIIYCMSYIIERMEISTSNKTRTALERQSIRFGFQRSVLPFRRKKKRDIAIKGN